MFVVSLAVGEKYEINGVCVEVSHVTKRHVTLNIGTPPGTDITREGPQNFKVTVRQAS